MYKRNNKILMLDTTFLFDQYAKRGIGRYGKEILKRLIKVVFESKGWELHLVGFLDLESNLIEAGLTTFAIEEFTHPISFHTVGKPNSSSIKNILFWESTMRPIIKDVNPDVYFGIHFERGLPSTSILGRGLDIKTVVTAHDTIPLINNSFSNRGIISNAIKKTFYKFMWSGVTSADAVFAPSENTKKDLITYGNVAEERIKKIYHGIDEIFYKENSSLSREEENEILETYGLLSKPYFFYDSGLETNKGIEELLEIFAEVSSTESMPNALVITGASFKKGLGKQIISRNEEGSNTLKLAEKLGVLHKIVATDKIPDEDLVVLLRNAEAYMYLSKYEGFGFGPLQAMAAEVPAIVANTSCLPEITDGGALLIDPENTKTAVEDVLFFLKNEKLLAERKKKGLEVVRRYNWDTATKELWQSIQKVAPVKK